MVSDRIPVEYVRGVDTVTVWMWPDSPDPVQVEFGLRTWARVERRAAEDADGDVGLVLGSVVDAGIGDS